MGGASIWHWIVVGVLVMVFFGRGKISEMMGDMAKGIKAFKKGMADDEPTPAPTQAIPHASPSVDPLRTIDHREPVSSPAGSSTLADRKLG